MFLRRSFVVALVFGAVWLGTPGSATVGGRPATEPYPFMVSLQTSENDRHRCGGSLVRPDWVLTAAHCVVGVKPKDLQIMIGSQKLSRPGDIIKIEKIYVHPKYEDVSTGDDAALLRLAKRSGKQPIAIGKPSQSKLWNPGTTVRAIGWGTNSSIFGQSPDKLHEVDVPVVSDADCSRSYTIHGFDAATMICAGETLGGKDTCQGDSGGPLMVQNERKRWVVFGVTSWGEGCAYPTFYGVYGEISGKKLSSWIDSVLP
jgi:trypsin